MKIRGITLPIVANVWTKPAAFEPISFIIITTIISTIAIPTAHPGCPNISDNWLPNATASAAAVPG